MVSVKEKIAYGLGDTASNIIFQTVMMFLMLYYTDVVGLSPAVCSWGRHNPRSKDFKEVIRVFMITPIHYR